MKTIPCVHGSAENDGRLEDMVEARLSDHGRRGIRVEKIVSINCERFPWTRQCGNLKYTVSPHDQCVVDMGELTSDC